MLGSMASCDVSAALSYLSRKVMIRQRKAWGGWCNPVVVAIRGVERFCDAAPHPDS